MGERQLLKSVVALDPVKHQPGEIVSNFYGRLHKKRHKDRPLVY